MKRLFASLMLITLAVMAYANPLVPRAIERVYFDTEGDFWVRVGAEADNFPPFANMVFTTTAGSYPVPDDYQLPVDLPTDINLNLLMPGFTITQAADQLTLDTGYWNECFTWGPANDFSVDLHPLILGQYAVQIHTGSPDGESAIAWAKDNHPTSTYPYCPESVCSLRVSVTNQSGSPAANVPVYVSAFHNWVGNYPSRYTDSNGQCVFSSPATRYYMEIRDPLTSQVVYSADLFPEPDQTMDITATVSGTGVDDPANCPAPAVLSIHPNVLSRSTGSVVSVSAKQFTSDAELRIYDLRGRLVAAKKLPSGGATEWDLSELGSGIYFIGLMDEGRIGAQGRVTIIK